MDKLSICIVDGVGKCVVRGDTIISALSNVVAGYEQVNELKAQNERLRTALQCLYSDCVNHDAVGIVDRDWETIQILNLSIMIILS